MPTLHISLHFIVPAFCAFLLFGRDWRRATWLMIATMLVDLDHLFAVPIYDPQRCSINFHPLHSNLAIGAYAIMCLVPFVVQRTARASELGRRLWTIHVIGLGLLLHMILDGIDCLTLG